MSKPVFTTAEADRHIEAIDAWWRANRDNVVRGIRRVLLRSTRNHVYYVEQEGGVLVVAVWGAVKGAGPDLTGP